MIPHITGLDSYPGADLPLHSKVPLEHIRNFKVRFEDVNRVSTAVVGENGPLRHGELICRSRKRRKRTRREDASWNRILNDRKQAVVAGGSRRKESEPVLSKVGSK